MKATALRRIVVWWIVPALIGAGLAAVSFVAATWDCQIPGCTHWFREVLAVPTRRCVTVVLDTLGIFLGFEGAAPFALASTAVLGVAAGVLVAQGVRCLVTRARRLRCAPAQPDFSRIRTPESPQTSSQLLNETAATSKRR